MTDADRLARARAALAEPIPAPVWVRHDGQCVRLADLPADVRARYERLHAGRRIKREDADGECR